MTGKSSILKGPVKEDIILSESLIDLLKPTFEKRSDKVALVFAGNEWTYRDIDQWSDEIAFALESKGVERGHYVGVWHSRGPWLQAAILGIMKSGACYVPFDAEMPKDRVLGVLEQVHASFCFSDHSEILEGIPTSTIPHLTGSSSKFQSKAMADDHCYILFTSGSTGKPKGIPIMHRQIAHLVRSENIILGITSEDRVYQGFSVSFDMWCEENWISLFAGATLYLADANTSKAIDELPVFLNKNRITILHAVPSLLALMDNRIPTLRLINAGGEACTPKVLSLWAGGNRRFINSYGPTETAVTSSMIDLKQGDRISIGHPLPNYNYAIVDEQLNILPINNFGELIISGPGVGQGYLNLPELTAEKFLDKPSQLSLLPGSRIYRTGDVAMINETGEVVFQGRKDDQIKLRGFRIELGEIESKLSQIQGIKSAAVAVRKDRYDQEQLVGYVVSDLSISTDFIRLELSKNLAPYMIPVAYVFLKELPRLTSGKIDRKSLPLPDVFLVDSENDVEIQAEWSISEKVYTILRRIFPGQQITEETDFFTDLGGHSLIAATFVSLIRNEAKMPFVALKDVYEKRTVGAIIGHWTSFKENPGKKKIEFQKVPPLRYFLCFVGQSLALPIIFGLFAAQIFLPYLGYYYMQVLYETHWQALLLALSLYCLIPPMLTLVSISAKWLLLGKVKEGDHPLWGWFYFRWWFVNQIELLVQTSFLNGTPLYPLYLRLRGMNVSSEAQISSITHGVEDLVEIGKNVSISSNVVFNNAIVEGGVLKLRKITIGDHAYIGTSSVINGGCRIGAWSEIDDLTCLAENTTVDQAEIWKGSPAKMIRKKENAECVEPTLVTDTTRMRYAVFFGLLLFIFPFAVLMPLFPVVYILNEIDINANDYDFNYLKYAPLLALLYIILFMTQTIVVTRLLQKGIKPGKYSIYSWFYIKKWLADQFTSLSLLFMHTVYATVYISAYFRALGAKVGKGTEISTASNVTHPLLKIGSGSFIADAVTLGESDIRNQELILNDTSVGDKSFVGNSALIPQGYHLRGNMLIGVLSMPPMASQISDSDPGDWFGSPAMQLPRRQSSGHIDEKLTSQPSFLRVLARAAVELLRIVLPETATLCFSMIFISFVHDPLTSDAWYLFILEFPLYYLAFIGIPCFLVTVILKWLIVGKYKEAQMPMWTMGVWRSEALTAIYEALANPFFLEYLKGTAWLPFMLRLLGVKIGKRVWMNTTDITEYDMVSIGDDVALNHDCGPQTHLFEDRVMKIGSIRIGSRTSIGSRSIVLYNTQIGDDVTIGSLSLVMKGEVVSNGMVCSGSPINPE